MAVKEEKYDLGYEAACGGAYSENPCSSEPCSFSSNGLTADSGESTFSDIPNGQWMTQSFTDQIPSFNNHCLGHVSHVVNFRGCLPGLSLHEGAKPLEETGMLTREGKLKSPLQQLTYGHQGADDKGSTVCSARGWERMG
eukprot:bmy_22212T0